MLRYKKTPPFFGGVFLSRKDCHKKFKEMKWTQETEAC